MRRWAAGGAVLLVAIACGAAGDEPAARPASTRARGEPDEGAPIVPPAAHPPPERSAPADGPADANDGHDDGRDGPQARAGETAEPPWEPTDEDPLEAAHPIEDPSGHALDGFYAALARTDDARPGALTRVTHMGDSSIGMDQLPHDLRRRFQDRFGDGGAGFVLLQPHGFDYRNRAVRLSTPRPWSFCFIIFRCRRDGHYGLGGVSAESRGGATTLLETRRTGDYGRAASHLALWYAAWPRGGTIELRVDQGEAVRIQTAAEQLEDRYYEMTMALGPHRVRVHAAGGGRVRAYGVVLETDGPGVVWDTLSMIGAFTVRMLAQDEAHFRDQLAHRRSDLVVLGYGGNDLRRVVGGSVPVAQLQAETTELLRRVKSALPAGSCLLTGIVEHERSGRTRIRPRDVAAVVEAQREAAREAGCAFFDVYGAMGGAGSFRRWKRRGLAAPDLKHLSPRGRERLAGWMYDALVSGYVRWRQGN